MKIKNDKPEKEHQRMSFTRWNFIMTILGILTFLFDIGADLWIAAKYFQQGLHLFGLLTIFFIIISTIIVQVFSYTWFKDDCGDEDTWRLRWVLVAHVFLSGTILRYWYAVKYGYQATSSEHKREECKETKKKAVDAMTDLSMLRLFKTYLESTPQLILQLYILLEHGQISYIQYASIMVSVSSISWSTVDYQMCLRKSLPGKRTIIVGIPALTYILYKLLTLTSWTLSIVFLLVCNLYVFAALLFVLGGAGMLWAWRQQTDFCKNVRVEILYRFVAGLILIFTFFNLKGQRTKIPISVYYFVRVLITTGILILCFYYKPQLTQTLFFATLSITVVASLGLGIISLILYYKCFHPTLCAKEPDTRDESDGSTSEQMGRFEDFLVP
uniref:XK-related protein n=1 Tax=Leptobrachium leishanense TaxID=445787 RepID=A0A8C5ML28_9ANUR